MKALITKSFVAILFSVLTISVASANCTCTMTNAKNQHLYGTGPTRAAAAANAQRACARNSTFVMNCKNTGCSCH